LFESEYCFAFNLAVEAAQVAIFSQALAAVQASPEYQKLYLKYFSQ
jgi:ABC-type amino acid transport substrate-binding protein